MSIKRGSEWRKWDLHFHTPSSFDYKDKNVSNQDIIDKLIENNVSVVAVTDHHKIDVERIKILQELGKDKVTILPGIELRSELGGSETIHFIGIFSESCDIADVWIKLQSKLEITDLDVKKKTDERVYCDLEDSAKIIHELGGVVTIHAGKKTNSIEGIKNNQQYKLQIKTDLLLKSIDILDIGNKDIDIKGYETLVFPNINKVLPLVICSDNHDIKSYVLKDNCWLKANPTFEGLKQVINEASERVFIGEMPVKNQLVLTNKTKYIDKVKINKVSMSKLDDIWFDKELQFNSNLVAIIGNKGNGKSAIADIIALCGNAIDTGNDNFSFLHKDRFKKPNLADNFEATLTWADGNINKINLSHGIKENEVQKVKYLPQKYIEKICTSDKHEDFQKEINKVVFSHILESAKLGKDNLKDLIDLKTAALNEKRTQLKNSIQTLFEQQIKYSEDYSKSKMLQMKSLIEEKNKEIAEHEEYKKINIIEVKKPEDDDATQTLQKEKFKKATRVNKHLSRLENCKIKIQKKLNHLTTQENIVKNAIEKIQIQIENFNKFKDELRLSFENTMLDLKIDTIISINYEESILIDKQKLLKDEINKINILIEKVSKQIEEKQIEIDNLNNQLDEVQKKYQSYIVALKQWDVKNKALLEQKVEYENKIKFEKEQLPKEREIIEIKKNNEFKNLFNVYLDELKIYDELYKPVLEFIDNEKEQNTNFSKGFIKFTTNIVIDKSKFQNKILDFFHGNKKNFSDDDIKELLDADIEINYLNMEVLGKNIENIISKNKSIEKQFRDYKLLIDFYMTLWSLDYLKIEYNILLDDKRIEQLSAGERGALLIIFYLLVDKDDIPLIIDQPEDNLDNESVYEYLVPYIKRAKQKRQIIIVTHNPNIAVVADAEQIIFTEIDKANKNKVKYISGAIEDEKINKKIVKVLEGTLPAFDNRTKKYFR